MSINLLETKAYDYPLPAEMIAQYPTDKREQSRLMHLNCKDKAITHKSFEDIKDILKEDDLLVLNNSKVIPARLFGKKANDTKIEVFLLNPADEPDHWHCLLYPAKRIKEEQWLYFSDGLKGWINPTRVDGTWKIRMEYNSDFWQVLDEVGHMPLPPYIKRADETGDKSRYQTVYAKHNGSVAAPTAGLHFTDSLIEEIKDKGIEIEELTLHVGLGTFRPVKTDNITDHHMHSELVEITPQAAENINKARTQGRRIVAVGSTSVRSLEAFYNEEGIVPGLSQTDIFIYPGYEFKAVDAMITNFHLPQSTLMMMVSAFGGYEYIKEAYSIAIDKGYRFFSYGDAMFIEK